jgi:glyoxylase-like metal-dependent hydrolase (beta-lactamase superfamily II)
VDAHADPNPISLAGDVYCLRGAVNQGLIRGETGLIIVDTGLDRGAANRVARAADRLGAAPVAIVNTHAHADHHGGNAHLVRRFGIPVFAPRFEAETIREPGYEPLGLFGAVPIEALRSRFLQAERSPVDHVFAPGDQLRIDGRALQAVDLAGHTPAQVGIRADHVLFTADAFFGLEPLRKHRVPFLADAGAAEAALRRLVGDGAEWMVPGHGEPLLEAGATIRANLAVMADVRGWVADRIRGEPCGTDALLAEWTRAFALRADDPTSWVLARATLLGYLGAMTREGEAAAVVREGRWEWIGHDLRR